MKTLSKTAHENYIAGLRKSILEMLSQLEDGHVRRFKQMYARNNGKRTLADAEAMPIEDVVAAMPEEKLSWASDQCERTLNSETP